MTEVRNKTALDALDIVKSYIGAFSISAQHTTVEFTQAENNAERVLRENDLPRAVREKLYTVADVAVDKYTQSISALQDVENEKKAIVQACVFCILYIVVFCVAVAVRDWRFAAFELVVAFVDYRYTGASSILRFLSAIPDAFKK